MRAKAVFMQLYFSFWLYGNYFTAKIKKLFSYYKNLYLFGIDLNMELNSL